MNASAISSTPSVFLVTLSRFLLATTVDTSGRGASLKGMTIGHATEEPCDVMSMNYLFKGDSRLDRWQALPSSQIFSLQDWGTVCQ